MNFLDPRNCPNLRSFLKEGIASALRFSEGMILHKISWLDGLSFLLSKERLQRFMDRERSLDDLLFTVNNYSGYWIYRSIRVWQIPSEIKQLLKEVKENGSSIILEIGTYKGGTLYLFRRFLESQKIITIDLPTAYPSEKIKLFKLFSPDKDSYFLRADSHSEETIKKISHILKSDKVDFLFIDGDHSYEGVRKDFEMYKPFVRDGGIIAFHDIIHPKLGVIKFWNEIKHKYASKEIVAPTHEMRSYARLYFDKQGWGGIGVLYI